MPGLSIRLPFTRTFPARSIACARSRDGARPRSTSRTSRRVFSIFGDIMGKRPKPRELRSPRYKKLSQLAQARGAFTVAIKFAESFRGQIRRNIARLQNSKERGISRFLLRLIFPSGLAQHGGRFLNVQDVVHHLKRPADIFAEASQTLHILVRRAAGDSTRDD